MAMVTRRRTSLLISQRPLGPGLEADLALRRDDSYWRARRGAAAALRALRSTHEPEAETTTPPAAEKDSAV